MSSINLKNIIYDCIKDQKLSIPITLDNCIEIWCINMVKEYINTELCQDIDNLLNFNFFCHPKNEHKYIEKSSNLFDNIWKGQITIPNSEIQILYWTLLNNLYRECNIEVLLESCMTSLIKSTEKILKIDKISYIDVIDNNLCKKIAYYVHTIFLTLFSLLLDEPESFLRIKTSDGYRDIDIGTSYNKTNVLDYSEYNEEKEFPESDSQKKFNKIGDFIIYYFEFTKSGLLFFPFEPTKHKFPCSGPPFYIEYYKFDKYLKTIEHNNTYIFPEIKKDYENAIYNYSIPYIKLKYEIIKKLSYDTLYECDYNFLINILKTVVKKKYIEDKFDGYESSLFRFVFDRNIVIMFLKSDYPKRCNTCTNCTIYNREKKLYDDKKNIRELDVKNRCTNFRLIYKNDNIHLDINRELKTRMDIYYRHLDDLVKELELLRSKKSLKSSKIYEKLNKLYEKYNRFHLFTDIPENLMEIFKFGIQDKKQDEKQDEKVTEIKRPDSLQTINILIENKEMTKKFFEATLRKLNGKEFSDTTIQMYCDKLYEIFKTSNISVYDIIHDNHKVINYLEINDIKHTIINKFMCFINILEYNNYMIDINAFEKYKTKGFLYIVKNKEKGRLKFGKTRDFDGRIETHKKNNYHLVKYFETDSKQLDSMEKYVLSKIKEQNIQPIQGREYFECPEQDVVYFVNLTEEILNTFEKE